METAVDITGGVVYVVMGTSQLMSVPYALYAKTSGNGPQGIQGVPGLDGAGALNCTYSIGDFVPALGGYVFYLDGTGCHGLVADANDLGLLAWDNTSFLASGTGDWVYAGENNTAKIVATYGPNAPAATACANSVLAGFSDWYLPSKIELNMMYLNLKFEGIGGFADTFYWSSSEFSDSAVLSMNFDNGMPVSLGKNLAFFVRAIRAF